MSGKHKRRARRNEAFARWCEKKADRVPSESRKALYLGCAETGRQAAKRVLRQGARERAERGA